MLSDTLCFKLTRVRTYLHNRRILATVYHVLSKFLIVLLKIISELVKTISPNTAYMFRSSGVGPRNLKF